MRSAIAILSLVASVVAEAPYHLPRPSTPFNYPQGPGPLPPQQHHHHHHAPPAPLQQQYQQQQQIFQSGQQYAQNGGYQYQQPNIQPAFVQPAPQAQYQVPQASLPIQYRPQHAYQQPAPTQFQPQPQPQPIYQQPAPQPIYQQPAPQPIYQQPAPQHIPQAIPQPRPQPQLYQPPSTSYGIPQFASRPQPQPIQYPPQPIPSYIAPQPRPLIQQQIQQAYQPQQQQFSQQQGYNYQQPQVQFSAQPQFSQAQYTQSQPLIGNTATALSSYQADSNQYNSAQVQGEALDNVVVNQVQNIIKENEHISARQNGYQSLVTGVSLENAKPSIEISSFSHTAPLNIGGSHSSSSVSAGSSSLSVLSPSADYGLPSISGSHSSESIDESASLSFLPHTKPATAYGPPNKK